MAEDEYIVKFKADLDELFKAVAKIKETAKDIDGVKANPVAPEAVGILQKLNTEMIRLIQLREQSTSVKEIKAYNAEIRKTQAEIQKLTRNTSEFATYFNTQLKQLGGTMIAVFSIQKLISFTQHLTQVKDQMDKINLSAQALYKDAFPKLQREAEQLASALGLTSTEYIGASTTIERLLQNMGLASTQTAEMRKQLIQTASTLALMDKNGRSASEIAEVLASSLTGSTKSLKSLGLVVKPTTEDIDQYGDATTSAAKAQAILNEIMEQTKGLMEGVDEEFLKGEKVKKAQEAQLRALEERWSGYADALKTAWLQTKIAFADFATGNLGKQRSEGNADVFDVAKAGAGLDAQQRIEELTKAVKSGDISLVDYLRSVRSLKVEVLETAKHMGTFASSAEFVDKAFKGLGSTAGQKGTQRTIADVKREIDSLSAALDKAGTKVEQEALVKKIKKLSDELDMMLGKRKETKSTAQRIAELGEAIKKLTVDISYAPVGSSELAVLTIQLDKTIALRDKLIKQGAAPPLFTLTEKPDAALETKDAKEGTPSTFLQDEVDRVLDDNKRLADALLERAEIYKTVYGNIADVIVNAMGLAGEASEQSVKIEMAVAIARAFADMAVSISSQLKAAALTSEPVTFAAKAAIVVPLVTGFFASVFSTLNQGKQQLSAIEAAKKNKFAEGVEYLHGAGTETSDSIPAMLSRGERVVTAEKNKRYFAELSAIHNDNFDEFIHRNYVMPAIAQAIGEIPRLERNDLAANIARSIMLSKQGNDDVVEALKEQEKGERKRHKETMEVLSRTNGQKSGGRTW